MDEQLAVPLLLLAVAVLLAALLAVRLSLREPIRRLTEWMIRARAGTPVPFATLPHQGLLAPLAKEAATLARNLSQAQKTAEYEAGLRARSDSRWTAEKLREHVRVKLSGRPLFVIANREPYRHVRRGSEIECNMPAGGVVTGLEPLLRACGGTWIAHGDGDADRETSDSRGRLPVPPGDPQYHLRRVWLTAEEEKGYYHGFSNEGLWPLCHIAHKRPTFRSSDWDYYRQVNTKFAHAALEEIGGVEDPSLLIQDYHFALLPKLIKQRRPGARVSLFWHIPWPNPEAFGICPWQNELLEGMLGADVIGFHTQFSCNNFLETVDRCLESQIDHERFSVRRGGHSTAVKPFPISVDYVDPPPMRPEARRAEKEAVRKLAGEQVRHLAFGVDRLDYTKGILERFHGVERFLERYPHYLGRFALIQIAAPSRTEVPSYRQFADEVDWEAKRINSRFSAARSKPILLLHRYFSRAQIQPFYRAADVCLVTSLHDGMNLVAKEFVVARDDENGVLLLSRFTGAARELRDALIVNPYDVDQVAEGIRAGIEMEPRDQALRMVRLREEVSKNNIYRWAGHLVDELAAVRGEPAVPVS